MGALASVYAVLAADAALVALVSTRIYQGRLPQKPTLPALVYTTAGGRRIGSLAGDSGLGQIRVQLEAVADGNDSDEVAEFILTAARQALETSTTLRGIGSETAMAWDDELEQSHALCDVQVWID
jgi:hypothetical protein